MTSSTKRRRGRAIASGVVCLALAGGAAVAIALRKPKSASTIEAPSIFKTASVSLGDLTTTERIDGIVQLSSTLPVLHRIEGQTSSTAAPAATTATTTPQAVDGPTNQNLLSSPLLADCSSTIAPTTTPESTTTAVPETTTTTPDTTPDTTPPEETSTTTSTTVAATEPSTTVATPIEPCDETSTTSTTSTSAVAVPDTVGGQGGQAPPTGSGRNAGSGSTATGSATSNARITQTITSIIATNSTIQQGDVLYTVDGAPVVALDGAFPAWRSLSISSDDGADIAQLEASLVALGYDTEGKVTVDNHFDSATRTMVKAWQQGLGVEATGTVILGSVVFLPSSTTVAAVDQAVGDTVGDGDTVLTLASPTQEVLVDVPAGDEAQVIPGLTVGIADVQGTVSRLRSADRDGTVIVEAVIAPASPIENATNGTAVKVTLTLQNDAGVLIAPAEALVSRLDGTYAVQAQAADGTTKWLTVELLGVSGGNVALRGADLSEGTVLLLPA